MGGEEQFFILGAWDFEEDAVSWIWIQSSVESRMCRLWAVSRSEMVAKGNGSKEGR